MTYGRITPASKVAPPLPVLWWPLDGGTSTNTGGESASGFYRQIGATGTTRDRPMVLTRSAGTVTWVAGGGLQWVAGGGINAYLEDNPGDGDDRDFMAAFLDLGAYEVGQTLMFGCELVAPTGYGAAQSTNRTLLCVGGLGAGEQGFAIRYASAEQLTVQYRAPDASGVASAAVPVNSGTITDDARNCIVLEFECTATNTFRLRTHMTTPGQAVTTSNYRTAIDVSDAAQGGTDGPSMLTGTGIIIGGKRSAGTFIERLGLDEILKNCWLTRFDATPTNVGAIACAEMAQVSMRLPPVIRSYPEGGVPSGSNDGNADETFGVITLGDMYVAINAAREIGDQPSFSIILEPQVSKKNTTADDLASWVSTADYEGNERLAASPGGLKFGRTTLAPASVARPAFIMSAYKTDQSNRNRCEVLWKGLPLPRDEVVWVAMELRYDWLIDSGQHTVITQWYHEASGSQLNPAMALTVYSDRIAFNVWTSAVEGVLQADQIQSVYNSYGLNDTLRGEWFDLVFRARVSWDASVSPFVEVYVNGTQVFNHVGPVGYRGPTGIGGLTTAESVRVGAYPGSTSVWTPDVPRDVYCTRAFVCKNVGNYSLEQVRSALLS